MAGRHVSRLGPLAVWSVREGGGTVISLADSSLLAPERLRL